VRALGVLLVALGTLSAAADSDPAVRFLKPRNLASVLGETTIRLHVDVEEGASVDRVEVRVDGELLATLTGPPWETAWDAGETGRAHVLEAKLHLTDGRQTRSLIRTSPLRIDQVERVDLVNLYLVVRDGSGRYVTDLTRDDFTIVEDGVPQEIERFTTTHKPLRVGIALDSSRSMIKQDRLEKAKKAALDFLEILEPGDEGTVVSFNEYVHVTQEFSADKALLARAIRKTFPAGGTALYDAVWRTSRLLEGFDGRRVMVLLSDGRDESASGFEPGSLHTLEEALDQALRSEVMVFPIGLGKGLDREYVRRWENLGGRSNLDLATSLADVLHRLAVTTGGRAVMSSSAGRLQRAFEEIAEDLRHQYSIAYSSTNAARDGRWRSIRVQTPGRTLKVLTRQGYYAPEAGKPDRTEKRR
jgi:VWFA-related protein